MGKNHSPGPWKVVTWRHANAGGTSLVYYFSETGFVVCTGPNPWGAGCWGPFPVEAASEVRDLNADDSWPFSGCSSERWTAEDVLASYERNGWSNTESLRAAIAKAEGRR